MSIGTLSSAGVGSGLDVNSIVSQLMALERRPLELLQQDKSKLDAQLSAFGRLQSSLGALGDAARKLTNPAGWSPTTVSSTDAAAVSAFGTGTPATGSYRVEVSALAAAQTLASAPLPSPISIVGTGMLTVELGKWLGDPPDFTPNSGTGSVSIAITAADNTLEKVRDRINAAGAGIAASIVNDANGARLSLRSIETGQSQGFRISVADDDGNDTDGTGLSMLAFDAAGGTSPMTLAQAASNAKLTVNGIAIESPSNTLDNVLDGLSLRVARVTSAPVALDVSRDTAAIKKTITDFANAYNDMVKLVREQTAYNEASKTGGALQGDRTAVGLLNRLRSVAGGSSGASAGFSRLADIGLDPQRDGTLKIDGAKLDAALGRLSELKDFFARDDTGTANDGFATMLRQFADLTLGTDGALSTKTASLNTRMGAMDKQAARLQDRLDATEVRLRAQYTRLDTNMASLNGLQTYISQQIAQWNRSQD